MYMFDVIVIGGGHAGVEAAHAVFRQGLNCCLVTFKTRTIGQMSCNPAIGGLGKSHLVREVDALGGIMAKATDRSGIQSRTLNTRKGFAVQALRVQCDRDKYKNAIQELLFETNITIKEGEVVDIILEDNNIKGVELRSGETIFSTKTILTTGTFLNGVMFKGNEKISGGRVGDSTSIPLSEKLYDLKLPMGRLKTGTPARIKLSSIDISVMEEQPGDQDPPSMSVLQPPTTRLPQISCYITRTNKQTHKIIEDNTHLSAMYSGKISGIGPRYCPSIEDKINKFSEKESHQIFIEPEGLDKDLVYPNGISTSLPSLAQKEFVESIKGLKNCEIEEYGYAVEYDFIDPRSLQPTLETKFIKNLYLAGQINGTTGYEEAAAQGLVAGINAAQDILDKPRVIFDRSEAYIGVLIDDLTLHGVTEPYRMFTSRAEFRLMLSQDTACQRLTKKAHSLGLITEELFNAYQENENQYQEFLKQIKKIKTKQNDKPTTGAELLKRTDIAPTEVKELLKISNDFNKFFERAANEIKYSGYIAKQRREVESSKRNERVLIPVDLNFPNIKGLSNEVVERLEKHKPSTLGQASRLEGVTPAAINLIAITIKKSELLVKAK
ncbi:MAG: tRNA uridine-5-carboxymethylaminomethyl(34) synthesis enzyme MnmG [SAR86 cluster bacterium]|uniref:tRNA uridine 5-carboxymethylaminomethyl modification enzyme MnmG n=1 Tax=SAR86 cluster bacterium TaxID=2030880 RepID=A0A368BJF3_9GAMM|nr:MAG: tRNA uridine-5-carboxymethylaminomethyl(34) synthesis enzyme MnmG [SAR86 cluster bacterium]